jgi:hypothetical protein
MIKGNFFPTVIDTIIPTEACIALRFIVDCHLIVPFNGTENLISFYGVEQKTNKRNDKQTSKQASKQASKQTNKDPQTCGCYRFKSSRMLRRLDR